ncbi:MAG: CPBP family intramembrane metalloprotease [Anaerolineaceae bacterium]|nr:CPBP family intramembrane metalloprotease [Anaerolineaceae bacterium]MCB9098071.1 CPBP family intramembrane metalloprotease [Anaerolineales bacterium]
MMNERLDTKRIYLYLLFAFGIAWAAALVIFLTGGIQHSPVLISGTPITLAFLLTATVIMWSPALAHILTRIITHEGWQIEQLQPKFKQTWLYWLTAWFLPGILTLGGLAVFLLIFAGYFDSSLSTVRTLIETNAPEIDLSGNMLWLIIAAQTIQAMIMAPLVNSFATFGEEFGWRAYLQPKLMPLGGQRAMLLLGLIWGVWHWPIILMGHNYGLDYPGAPVLGPLAMVWFTLVLGIFLGWLTLKSGSVWPAVIGHAAINGIAGLGTLFVHGEPNPLLGPLPSGLIGGIGFTLVALLIFFSPKGLSKPQLPRKIKKQAATKTVTTN